MATKTPDWQDNEKEILSQFSDTPAPELLSLRQEPDPALRKRILSIPQDVQETNNRFNWLLGYNLLNHLAGAAVLVLLVGVLAIWIYSLASTNQPTPVQPEAVNPIPTDRPTEEPTILDKTPTQVSGIATPIAAESNSCPDTKPQFDDPQDDPDADLIGEGEYFINENRTIWAELAPGGWQTGGEKVLWIKPVGSELTINGRLLDQENGPLLDVTMPCCYAGGFQITGLYFPVPGCWEITAEAGEETLQFVTEVASSAGLVVTGLTLLDYQLSNSTLAASGPLTLTLNWQAGGADAEELIILFQLIDSTGNIVVQYDETIQPNVWIAQNVSTTHSIETPQQTGIFTLRLILANNETFTCVPFYYNDELIFCRFLTLPGSLEVASN